MKAGVGVREQTQEEPNSEGMHQQKSHKEFIQGIAFSLPIYEHKLTSLALALSLAWRYFSIRHTKTHHIIPHHTTPHHATSHTHTWGDPANLFESGDRRPSALTVSSLARLAGRQPVNTSRLTNCGMTSYLM
ncbi:unnamed protein product [Protopolystoma xenopodis]|uniref:Uncharacterized protein n=1 Tax=Protopolystoma xenopodis TaxID=117903 RepID=A0A448XEC5_9PLAT|nr:unnamed protein product [Protopolystoma xenopodis]